LGPVCPGCRKPLNGNLAFVRLDARATSETGNDPRYDVIYCGSCGLSLHIEPVQTMRATPVPVADPQDPTTLDDLFQLRCRDLVEQIREMGFEPHVWVDMINDLGATVAARRLLATNTPVIATHWLISQGRPELALEHEIMDVRWADLFDDDERAKAERRLSAR
jgi:hypothetical protein